MIDKNAVLAAVRKKSQLLPGYYYDPETLAWCTLPWPGDVNKSYSDISRLKLLPPSLGPAAIRWAENYLVHPNTGGPWRFTTGQRRFLYLWYALDEKGNWLYRYGLKRGAKGVGKDPFGSALSWIEACGPCMFAGWDEQGDPIPAPRHRVNVQIFSNSQTQSREMLQYLIGMPGDEIREAENLDLGVTRVRFNRGKIETPTASVASTEGAPITFAVLNESHHMTESNGGDGMASVVRRNIAKSPIYEKARILELTNAHTPGENSVAEQGFKAWQNEIARYQATGIPPGILYDSIEADPGLDYTNIDHLAIAMQQACMDAPWLDLDRRVAECLDTRNSVADIIRFYFNGLAVAEDQLLDPRAVDDQAVADFVVPEKTRITMCLDCSKSGDSTALVGCVIPKNESEPRHVFKIACWEAPRGEKGKNWVAPRDEVEAVVRHALDFYRVQWFGIDPSPATDDETDALYWGPMIDRLHREYKRKLPVWATPGGGGNPGNAVLFDMRQNYRGAQKRLQDVTQTIMQTVEDFEVNRSITWDGDPVFRRHLNNARRRPNKYGVSFGKVTRDSSDKVDLVAAMMYALHGCKLVLDKRGMRRESSGLMLA